MNKKVLLMKMIYKCKKIHYRISKDYGFECTAFSNPKMQLIILKFKMTTPIIILDLMLPLKWMVLIYLKTKNIKDIPIIISSARGDIGNKIHGFELGADDYLAKPYEPRELVLRIEHILKEF